MSEMNDQYNRGGMLAFAFSMAFVIVFLVYLVVIHPGVDLDEKVIDPNAAVSADQVTEFDIATVSEPWVANDQVLEYGKKIYGFNCASCHGNDGKGDGAAGAALNPKPRNLVEGQWTQGEGIISHYKVLQNGIAGTSMPGFAHFKSADRWAILQYIESITQNKSKDDTAAVAEFAKSAN